MAGLLGTKSVGGLLGTIGTLAQRINQSPEWQDLALNRRTGDPMAAERARMMRAEEERARREAEIREQQLQMQIDQQAKAQERQQYTQALLTAASSQNPGLLQDPAFQSQLRMKAAAYGDPAMLEAGGLLLKPQEPMKPTATMQNIAAIARPGTPEYDALMREAIIKPRNSVTINNGLTKPPTGYTWINAGDPAQGVRPLPGGPADPSTSKEGRDAASNIARVDQSLKNYREAVTRIGTQVLPASEKIVLSGAHTDLLMEMKELYNLGVLNGPDYELMLGVIKDPTSVWTVGQGYTGKDLLNQLDKVVVPKLEAAKKLYQQKYNRPYNVGAPGSAEGGAKPVSEMTTEELMVELERLQREGN